MGGQLPAAPGLGEAPARPYVPLGPRRAPRAFPPEEQEHRTPSSVGKVGKARSSSAEPWGAGVAAWREGRAKGEADPREAGARTPSEAQGLADAEAEAPARGPACPHRHQDEETSPSGEGNASGTVGPGWFGGANVLTRGVPARLQLPVLRSPPPDSWDQSTSRCSSVPRRPGVPALYTCNPGRLREFGWAGSALLAPVAGIPGQDLGPADEVAGCKPPFRTSAEQLLPTVFTSCRLQSVGWERARGDVLPCHVRLHVLRQREGETRSFRSVIKPDLSFCWLLGRQ